MVFKKTANTSPKKPRKVTAKRLHNQAIYYLGRYDSSTAQLRKILTRKTDKSIKAHGIPTKEEASNLIEAEIQKLIELDYINDARYAQNQAISLNRRHKSTRFIQNKLYQKGVAEDIIKDAINLLKEENPNADWIAACNHARKKRLGPYRRHPLSKDIVENRKAKNRELGSLARAGFSMQISQKIINAKTIEELV